MGPRSALMDTKRRPGGFAKAQVLGRSRGGLSTKLYVPARQWRAARDGNGLPLTVHLMAGVGAIRSVRDGLRARRGPAAPEAAPSRPGLRHQADLGVATRAADPGGDPGAELPYDKRCRRRGRPPVLDRAQYARRNAVER